MTPLSTILNGEVECILISLTSSWPPIISEQHNIAIHGLGPSQQGYAASVNLRVYIWSTCPSVQSAQNTVQPQNCQGF